MIERVIKFCLPAVLIALGLSCNTTEPPPPHVHSMEFEAVDASCTEVWLEVKLAAGLQPRTLTLQRDTQTVLSMTLTASDTLIVDEGLLPNRQYTYTLTRSNGLFTERATATITTMDTTSHNFTWQIDTLGDGGSSVLLDVAIINDTLAYAVGEMYVRDSIGQIDPQAWNAAKWNGQRWELKRIPFIGPCSAVLYPPLRAIWAFSATNILVSNGGSIVRYDGTNAVMDCGMNALLTGAINRIWGTTPQDVYAVGNVGAIVHYNGSTWQRVESGTTLDVYDVYGNGGEVLAVAAEQFVSSNRRILRLTATGVDTISSTGILFSLHGVWFTPHAYYVIGAGVYTTSSVSPTTTWRALTPQITNFYTYAIRGQRKNDILVGGAFGEVLHFNGVSWRSFRNQLSLSAGSYRGVGINDHLCVLVGYDNPFAVVAIGRRTN